MFEWLKRKDKRSIENPAVPLSEAYDYLVTNLPSAAGQDVNELTQQKLPTIYAAITLISDSISTLPMCVYRRTENGTVRDDAHPAAQLIMYKPNRFMTVADFMGALMYETLAYGNGYVAIDRDGRVPVGLRLLSSSSTAPVLRNGNEYVYRTSIDGATYEIPAENIIHLRGLSHDGVVGFCVAQKGREAIGWSLAAQEFSSKFFANGASLQGVLTAPGAIKDPEKLRRAWDQAYAGSHNSGKTAVLEHGMAYNRIGVPPDEAQFLSTVRLQREEMAALFRVPPHMVGIMDHATFSNIEHMNISFVQHTLTPWITRINQEFTCKLLEMQDVRNNGLCIKMDAGALLRGDQQTRYDAYQKSITAGWMTRNEARELESLNPIDGLDEPLQPLNMATDQQQESEDDTRLIRLQRQVASRSAKRIVNRLTKTNVDGDFLTQESDLLSRNLCESVTASELGEMLNASKSERDLTDAIMRHLGVNNGD